MKRIAKSKKAANRKKIEQAALEQLRETRAQIKAHSPGLLRKIREEIAGRGKRKANEEIIDKQKNIETISQFLELNTDNPAMNKAIKILMANY